VRPCLSLAPLKKMTRFLSMPNRPGFNAGTILGWPMFIAGLGTMGVAGANQVQGTLGGLPVVGEFFKTYIEMVQGVASKDGSTGSGARGGIGVGGLAMTAIGGWGIGMLHY
jgi:hypothetical protein